jgi:type IV pilus assembly protein PilW
MLGRVTRRSAGLSLVELMVGIVVGLLVLWGMSSVYVNSARGGRTTNAANQLNQDLRAVMDIMANDLRRAGYWANAAPAIPNPFMTATTWPVISGAGNGCIVYSYDATYAGSAPGAVNPGVDFFGFRLTENGTIQTLDQVNSATLSSTATSCDNIAWENLTDGRSIRITALTFDSAGSQCIAFVPSAYKADDSSTYVRWATSGTYSGPACHPAASGAPATYPDTATHAFVETRQINIVLTGRSLVDAALPEQTVRETVFVRSNRVVNPP